jgi:hypothetical protein
MNAESRHCVSFIGKHFSDRHRPLRRAAPVESECPRTTFPPASPRQSSNCSRRYTPAVESARAGALLYVSSYPRQAPAFLLTR